MKQIRYRVIALICWVVLYCAIELLLEPLPLGGIPLSLGLSMTMIMLAIPRAVHIPWWMVVFAPFSLLLGLEVWAGKLARLVEVPLTILEAGGITVTLLLAQRVNHAIGEFENTVARITVGRCDRLPESDAAGQGALYREVRRARNHQRPLALLAVSVEERSIQSALDRLVEEAQSAMMKQVALAGVSKTLCENLSDCDLIVQNGERFLVLLPETTSEDVPGLIERLRRQVTKQVGVELNIGVASLPRDGYTMEGLVEKATRQIEADNVSMPFIELSKLSVQNQSGLRFQRHR